MSDPFDLNNTNAYAAWRNAKLTDYPMSVEAITLAVADPSRPSTEEIRRLKKICSKTNTVIYRSETQNRPDRNIPISLGAHLGLSRPDKSLTTDDDGVTELRLADNGPRCAYIPYSDRFMGWHTDGCYRDQTHRVHGFLLHCARPALDGGESFLLDPDIAYILLRDENPDYIAGLMKPDALVIPANIKDGTVVRPEYTGPVFSIDLNNGCLHMRYTARKKFVTWQDDSGVQEALQYLETLLAGSSPYIFRARLQAGWGVVGNNVLHGRTAFTDGKTEDQRRLIYRIYFLDRINHREHAA